MIGKSRCFIYLLLSLLMVVSVAFGLVSCNNEPVPEEPGPEDPVPILPVPETTFPEAQLGEFMDVRSNPVTIPSPYTTGTWEYYAADLTFKEQKFSASYKNDGTPEYATLYTGYVQLLEDEGWEIGKTEYWGSLYPSATKEDVTIIFYTEKNSENTEEGYNTYGFSMYVFAARRIYAESFRLSGKSEIALGRKSAPAIVTVPADANMMPYSWTSSDENVATVEDGIITTVSEGNTTITARMKNAAGEDLVASMDISVVPLTTADWTILIYMCGSTLESENGLASRDIEEMLSAPGQPDDINIVIQTGGSSKWSNPMISADQLGRYHVESGNLVMDDKLPDASMGDPGTLSDFMIWGMTDYPAEKTALILWNHGAGMEGVCVDENHLTASGRRQDRLYNEEVDIALSDVFVELGLEEKLEFIGYDACIMQIQDVAAFNARYFKYMVGSEEASGGLGWDYDNWLVGLYAEEDTETVLGMIALSYEMSFTDPDAWDDGSWTYFFAWNDNYLQTQSVLDLSGFDAYHDSFEALAGALAAMEDFDIVRFKELMKTVKSYGIDTEVDEWDYEEYLEYGYLEEWFHDGEDYWGDPVHILPCYYEWALFDAMDFLNKLDEDETYDSLDSYIADAKAALEELVVFNCIGEDAGESYGLSLYCPVDDYMYYYEEDTLFPAWRELVKVYEEY